MGTLLDRLLAREPAEAPPMVDEAGSDPLAAEPPDCALRARLAEKVLHGWMQNRHQVLVPLALDLSRQSQPDRALLLRLAVVALLACGVPAETAKARLAASLPGIGATGDDDDVAAALRDRTDLVRLLAAMEAGRLAAPGYAVVARMLDRRHAVEAAFLDFLARRFALSPPLLSSLHRRYGR